MPVFQTEFAGSIPAYRIVVIVAQLVRALGCGPKGCEFEPRLSPLYKVDAYA